MDEGWTVADERARIRRERAEGTTCACCGRTAQEYRRYLYVATSLWLILLARKWRSEPRFYHVKELIPFLASRWPGINFGGGDYGKLRFWGLVAQRPKDGEDTHKKASGAWRPTPRGLAFADNRLAIPKHAIEYQGRLLRLESEEVTIRQVMAKQFDYEEVCSRT